MQKLMDALGEDGLDDFGRAQLRALVGEEDENDDDGGESEEDDEAGKVEDGESKDEDEEVSGKDDPEEEDTEGTEEEEDGVALDDVSDAASDVDVVPRQKLEINNIVALDRIRESMQLDPSLPWTETLVVPYPQRIEIDVHDDLKRELAFYKQALHSATAGRALAQKHSFPFTRPADFFAEMIKSDAHMQRIRQRLLDEQAGIKKSEEKRKEREGKKFGKQVQVERIKERERAKKDMEERVKGLKRKRKGALRPDADNDDFDVAIEDAIADRPVKRARAGPGDKRAKMPRHVRDNKFGLGGAGKRAKQNTRASTDEFAGGGKGRKGGKGGTAQRPGKARRMAAKGKS
ncbi:eukaryotic rRNA processing protein EBP2-domain-containing protein [Vararia minispora EC-137]|uniref:Eukaryotic rRNA processing protein EBP2-domain-containing protein n=1 Tax=Vararia minispora EC-137 TaxID=1314806 RepID=A0ACB8QGY1_9AGAM|nr:eukaryotic rRNA processing protein EBP2-domain-containing protein [Vararia minispora EC-137]